MHTSATITRRSFLAGAAGSLYYLVPGAFADELLLTPRQTEGPFYPTALPLDQDNDLVSVTGQQARARGTIAHVSGRVLDLEGRPVQGMVVNVRRLQATPGEDLGPVLEAWNPDSNRLSAFPGVRMQATLAVRSGRLSINHSIRFLKSGKRSSNSGSKVSKFRSFGFQGLQSCGTRIPEQL